MAYVASFNTQFGRLGAQVAQLWPEGQVIANKGKKTDTLGLALSGGGYRSAIFCYGVLKGLWDIGVLQKVDYLSAVSGGSWIATPYAMAEDLQWFFKTDPDSANVMEEGFESLLANPLRLAEEAVLTRFGEKDKQHNNYVNDLFGRLLAKTFLREHGDYSRWKPLAEPGFIQDSDRPFLIVNGTTNFRRPNSFDVTQECFEMTRLYCGSRSLGYKDAASLLADDRPIRVRDAIAISGAAVSVNIAGLGAEVTGLGLGREIENYAKGQAAAPANAPEADRLDVDDGGHYNNLGIESLVNRGCGFIIVVDAEHDPENKSKTRSNQAYSGLKTLMKRHHIPQPAIPLAQLDRADEAVHLIKGAKTIPDILYVKLKSSSGFDKVAAKQRYNKPGFLKHLFSNGDFSFDPQYSTAKLDYSFAEHRNLSELGAFLVKQSEKLFSGFARQAK